MALFNNNKPVDEPIDPNNLIAAIEMSRVELPQMSESINYKFINYGADNRYPQFLAELSKTSALHRTLIDNKAKMMAGSDILVNDIPLNDWINTLSGLTAIRVQNLFFNSKFPLRDWIKRASYDYQLFGAYTTEVIWSSEFEYVKAIKHIDTSKIRSGVRNRDGVVDKYYYSRDWSSYNVEDMTPISVFDIENDTDINQIIYKKDYYPNLNYYTEPSYIAGLTYISLDSELGQFNLSHIQNGMNPGLIFKIPYQFKSAEEKQAFMGEFFNHFRGARNNNNPLILANNGEAQWEIETIETKDFDAQLIALGDFILQQLIFAHKITNGALVGLLVPGRLGGVNSEELAFSKNQFDEFVINPARLMLEEVLEDVLRTHQLSVKVKIV